MSITINGELETKLREEAEAGDSTVEAYLERIVRDHELWERQLEDLAIEGIESGEAFEAGPAFWEEQHEWLDQTMKRKDREDLRIPPPSDRYRPLREGVEIARVVHGSRDLPKLLR